jgi:hypothetical protein
VTDPCRGVGAAFWVVIALLGSGVAGRAQIWKSQGPGPSINGQVENIVGFPVVGAVNVVISHPTNSDVLWLGATNGGIWKTTNATAASPHWVPQTDRLSSLSIGSLDLDPTDGSHQTLAAGTGDRSSWGDSGELGTVFRTTDGGASWTRLTGNGLSSWDGLVGIAARGATIVACGYQGLYRSTDTGASFVRLSTTPGSGAPTGWCWDLAGDPLDSTRLFAAFAQGVYRSTNTGATWVKVSDSAVDAQLGNPNLSRGRLAVGNHNEAYIAIAVNGRLAALFRSGDSGGSWSELDVPITNEFAPVGIHPGYQAFIHLSLVADPANLNLVYIGGDRQPSSSEGGSGVGAHNFTGRLFRIDASKPRGSQFAHLTHSRLVGPAGGGTLSSSAPHADSRDMVFDAAGNLIEGDDGGIYKRTSPQTNLGDWFSLIGDAQTTEFHDIAWDTVSNRIVGGTQDNGTPNQGGTGSVVWDTFIGGDGSDVAVDDRSNPTQSIRYMSFQLTPFFYRITFDSAGAVVAWAFPSETLVGGGSPPTGQFDTPVVLNASQPSRLVIGANNGVYESYDRGDTIRSIAAGLRANSAPGAIAYGSSSNPDILYVGADVGVWIRTAAHPAPLVESLSYPGRSTGLPVLAVALDEANPATAFTIDSSTFSGSHVYMTSNTGSNWSEITGNLMALGAGQLNSLLYVSTPVPQLLVGTLHGVFASSPASWGTWFPVGNGLPNVRVYDLDYDAADTVLIAGTLGRGAWKLTAPQPVGQWIFADGFESANLSAWTH